MAKERPPTVKDKVRQAEREIAGILADLETSTECYIDKLGIEKMEVTEAADIGEAFMLYVKIELRRAPGCRWLT